MKINIEIEYQNTPERIRHRQKIEELVRLGVTSYSNENFSFAIDKEVKQEFPISNFVRFQEVNGLKCIVIQSKLNF
jgi:hypothetical protein